MKNTRKLALIGIFSAIAFILMLAEFPLAFIIPEFVKFDFSELPALICSFAAGPVAGLCVCLVKNLLHLAFSQSAGVGELANFILGGVFVFCAGALYQRDKCKSNALIASVIGAALAAVISVPVNAFITYPFYTNFMPELTIIKMYQVILPSIKSLMQALVVFNAPFTFAKFIIDAAITFAVYKRISPLLKGKNKQ